MHISALIGMYGIGTGIHSGGGFLALSTLLYRLLSFIQTSISIPNSLGKYVKFVQTEFMDMLLYMLSI